MAVLRVYLELVSPANSLFLGKEQEEGASWCRIGKGQGGICGVKRLRKVPQF